MENKSICHRYLHVLCSVCVNTSNINIFCIWGFLSAACGLRRVQFAKEGFGFPLLSCPMWAPQNGDHHTFIIHFTGVNSPFSTASAGLPHSPFSPPLACVRSSVVYWTEHLAGLAFHHGSCWHHVPPPWAAGRQHAGHCFTHPPASPRGHCPPSSLHFTWPWWKPAALIGYQIPA